MSEDLYYLGFSQFFGIGPRRFTQLIEKFGTAKKAWQGKERELYPILKDVFTRKFLSFREEFDIKTCANELQEKKIGWIPSTSHVYPKLLKQAKYPPFLLYYKGDVSMLNSEKPIAIVGTRKITDYGSVVTQMLTGDLVANGFTIVSGLALGVDAKAHMTTLQSGGKTIAVLGCGVDICLPRENQYIYDKILITGGTVVSTFLPGQGALIGSFPARNAIIAGLSLGVVVTEGAEDSGALITAHDAEKLQRPVFSVPGPITSSLSKGTNNLLKKGAIAVTSASEILDSLDIITKDKSQAIHHDRQIKGSTTEEQTVLDFLQPGPLHFDEIARKIEKDSKTVGSLLSLMELKGMIRSIQGSMYSI